MLFDDILGCLLVVYFMVFYLATAWEIIYQIVELLKPSEGKNVPEVKLAHKNNKNQVNNIEKPPSRCGPRIKSSDI